MSDVLTTSDEHVRQVPANFKMSKSWATRILKRYLLKPELLNRSTVEDRTTGNNRWHVFYTGADGARRPLFELVGPADTLPKAAVVSVLDRLGFDVDLKVDHRGTQTVLIRKRGAPVVP